MESLGTRNGSLTMTTASKHQFHRACGATALLIAGLSPCLVGCESDLAGLIPGLVEQTPEQPASGSERVPDQVTLRFRNFTASEAVDVEFFAAEVAPANLPDGLFVEQHRVTASLGVAGTGIVQPLREDVITLPCTPSLTVGVLGGRFLDNETGEFRGTGAQRWLQEGPLSLCGSTVTFEFSGAGDTFTTTVRIGD